MDVGELWRAYGVLAEFTSFFGAAFGSKQWRDHGDGKAGNGNFVFCHSDGSPLDPDLVPQAFKRMAKKPGLGELRLHDLRHTHAVLMLSEGIHPRIVSE